MTFCCEINRKSSAIRFVRYFTSGEDMSGEDIMIYLKNKNADYNVNLYTLWKVIGNLSVQR